MSATITVIDQPTSDDRAAILAPLAEYNQRSGHPIDPKPIALLLRKEDGEAVGGLWGKLAYDWLFIELLAIPESMRGKNYGAGLMAQAEELAHSNGCIGIWLTTFALQSRGFYERIGYSVFGEMSDHPAGSARYFLSKRF